MMRGIKTKYAEKNQGNTVIETLKYDLQIPYPPSVNTYWRNVNGRTLLSRKARAYRQSVYISLAEKRIRAALPITCKIGMDIFVWPPDNRRRDLDNCSKAIGDVLQNLGFYKDDSQIDRLQLFRKGKVYKGMVQVKIYEICNENV
jgi:crossover junction endodeoxyribonuclease RusA